MDNINFDVLINEGYQLQANSEALKIGIRKSKNILLDKLKESALSSETLDRLFETRFELLERLADNIQVNVNYYGKFIAETVPDAYIETHKNIENKFNCLKNPSPFGLKNRDIHGGDWMQMETNS